jgi:L-alanine-DL-glutamate epimerase-like enolase superfamily enzyme/oxalate decarboxylase/phosphoglucose isomerase-like protein (cupin superfamily)
MPSSSIVRIVLALFWLPILAFVPPACADEPPATAVELLTAFSGQSAERFTPFFRFSEEARITGIEIHAVGNESTTAKYTGGEVPWREVNNILRITTADGSEGVSGVDSYYQGPFSDEHLSELLGVAADLLALQSLDPVEVRRLLGETRPDLSDAVRASIDIALWDLAAQKADLPLYELLGARRHSVDAYASLPFYESLTEYVDAVNEYAELGYTVFKFHVWGEIDKDLELVERVQEAFANTSYKFMVDLESVYDLQDAIRLGRQMDEGLFIWFEAPIDDARLADYSKLKSEVGVTIIPAGYTYYSAEYIRQGIDSGAWDAGRYDATVVGGITDSLELLAIANEARLPIEFQSWGHSLAQAANLHLVLANDLTEYFEAPMPGGLFEFGMTNGRLTDHGTATVPDQPGLGVRVDWDSLAAADFHATARLDLARGHSSSRPASDEDRPFLLNYPKLEHPDGKVVLTNDHLVLQRLFVPAGEWEGIHSHPGNQIYVHIKGGEWSGRLGGEPEYSAIESPDGEVGWMDAIPLSAGHESGNTGDTDIDLIYVTLKDDVPIAPDAAPMPQVFPDIPLEMLLENERMIVQRVNLEPGQSTGIHSHPGYQAYVVIKAGDWAEFRAGKQSGPSLFREAGAAGWLDTRDGHDVGNVGDTTIEFVLVTIK